MIISAKQQLCDLYNAANPTLPNALSVADFSTGTIGPITPEDDNLSNTAVSINANAESVHFTGSMTWRYRRRPVGFSGSEYVEESPTAWAGDAYVVAYFNTMLQRQYPNDEMSEDDIVITRTDNAETGGVDVSVSVKNHLRFEDNDIVYNVVAPKTDLSSANGELDNFN